MVMSLPFFYVEIHGKIHKEKSPETEAFEI
jgi:hypothetical protein